MPYYCHEFHALNLMPFTHKRDLFLTWSLWSSFPDHRGESPWIQAHCRKQEVITNSFAVQEEMSLLLKKKGEKERGEKKIV